MESPALPNTKFSVEGEPLSEYFAGMPLGSSLVPFGSASHTHNAFKSIKPQTWNISSTTQLPSPSRVMTHPELNFLGRRCKSRTSSHFVPSLHAFIAQATSLNQKIEHSASTRRVRAYAVWLKRLRAMRPCQLGNQLARGSHSGIPLCGFTLSFLVDDFASFHPLV